MLLGLLVSIDLPFVVVLWCFNVDVWFGFGWFPCLLWVVFNFVLWFVVVSFACMFTGCVDVWLLIVLVLCIDVPVAAGLFYCYFVDVIVLIGGDVCIVCFV